MPLDIHETPLRFSLHGRSGIVTDQRYAEVGMRLMNEMWQIVKTENIPNLGINHWVYLPQGRMFTGVELAPGATAPENLESLEFQIDHYLKYVHIGAYHLLPQVWERLTAELTASGEILMLPSLEVYGHHCDDEAQQETTVLIGLGPRHV
jgi:hypothetical protein